MRKKPSSLHRFVINVFIFTENVSYCSSVPEKKTAFAFSAYYHPIPFSRSVIDTSSFAKLHANTWRRFRVSNSLVYTTPRRVKSLMKYSETPTIFTSVFIFFYSYKYYIVIVTTHNDQQLTDEMIERWDTRS